MVFSHKCGLNTRYVLSTVYEQRVAKSIVRIMLSGVILIYDKIG